MGKYGQLLGRLRSERDTGNAKFARKVQEVAESKVERLQDKLGDLQYFTDKKLKQSAQDSASDRRAQQVLSYLRFIVYTAIQSPPRASQIKSEDERDVTLVLFNGNKEVSDLNLRMGEMSLEGRRICPIRYDAATGSRAPPPKRPKSLRDHSVPNGAKWFEF